MFSFASLKATWVRYGAFVILIALVAAFGLAVASGGLAAKAKPVTAAAGHYLLIQDEDPEAEIAVIPDTLQRLSWGGIIAGTIVALVIQLGLNLLAVAVGATSIHPQYDKDSASPKSLALGGAAWVVVSALASLLIGGWMAAHFAGIPDRLTGVMHGLTVWALTTLLTMLLLTTTVGRIMSGTTSLISQGLHLATRAADVAARGAVDVAQTTARGVANVAAGTANAAQNVASGMANAAQNTASTATDAAQQAMDQSPEMRQALQRLNVSRQDIEREARTLMEQAGMPPQRVQNEANAAMNEVRGAVQQARHAGSPQEALQVLNATLDRVLVRGEQIVNDVDRQSVVDLLTARTNMSEDDARQTLNRWEQQFIKARMEADQTRDQLMYKMQQIPQQARAKVEEVRSDVMQKVEQVVDDAEQMVRDVAEATTKAIAALAAAAFAAMLFGAIAGGLGGLMGAPTELPTAEIDDEADGVQQGTNHYFQDTFYLANWGN